MTFPTGSGLPEAGSDFPEAGSDFPEAGSGLPEAGLSLSEAGSGLRGRGRRTNGRTDGQMDGHTHRFPLYSTGHHPLWVRVPKSLPLDSPPPLNLKNKKHAFYG